MYISAKYIHIQHFLSNKNSVILGPGCRTSPALHIHRLKDDDDDNDDDDLVF